MHENAEKEVSSLSSLDNSNKKHQHITDVLRRANLLKVKNKLPTVGTVKEYFKKLKISRKHREEVNKTNIFEMWEKHVPSENVDIDVDMEEEDLLGPDPTVEA